MYFVSFYFVFTAPCRFLKSKGKTYCVQLKGMKDVIFVQKIPELLVNMVKQKVVAYQGF